MQASPSRNPLEPNEAYALAAMTVDGKPMFNWLPGSLPEQRALQLALTVATELWYNIYGTETMVGRTHVHVPVDNSASVYVSLLDPSAPLLISGVQCLSSTPDARNYLEHWYQPTGRLSIPVFVLHTSLDPIVPVFHAYACQQLFAPQGDEGFLKVVEIPFFGHCQIPKQLPAYPWFEPDDALFASYLLG